MRSTIEIGCSASSACIRPCGNRCTPATPSNKSTGNSAAASKPADLPPLCRDRAHTNLGRSQHPLMSPPPQQLTITKRMGSRISAVCAGLVLSLGLASGAARAGRDNTDYYKQRQSIGAAYGETGLKVCNDYDSYAQVAIAYNKGYWVSEGWWGVGPGDCIKLRNGSLRNKAYYIYARVSNGSWWGGSTSFCISDTSFTFRQTSNCQSAPFTQAHSGSTDGVRFTLY